VATQRILGPLIVATKGVLRLSERKEGNRGSGTASLLWSTVWQYRAESLLLVAMLVVAGLAEGVGLLSLLPLLDEASGEADSSTVGQVMLDTLETMGLSGSVASLLLLIVVAIAVKAGVTMAAERYSGHLAARVATNLRMDLLGALMGVRWSYFVSQPLGEIANSMSGEAIRASHVFTHGTRLVSYLIQMIVFTGLAIAVSWQIALTAVFVGGIMILSLNSLVRMARTAGRTETVVQQKLVGRLTDALSGIKPLKAMGLEAAYRPRLEAETGEIDEAYRRKATSTAILNSIQEPIVVIFMAIMLFILITRLDTPFSELVFVAFLFYRVLTRVGGIQSMYQRVVLDESALQSIQSTITEAQGAAETHSGSRSPTLDDAIEFDRVSFAYDQRVVLDDVSFRIPWGSFCTLSGPSGVGKSTTADLIVGLQSPDSGRIMVDDIDLRDVDMAAWRSRIGYVPQDVVLFHDSIFMNVGLGIPTIDRSDVERALKQADLWDYVSSLPAGLDTQVGERGAKLSGGQRQRLALARALVRSPLLLILDEATTGLDPDTERSIISTLGGLRGTVTILAISHQHALVEAAQLVLVMDSGAVFPRRNDAAAG
jgi:ATP-binding cassette subfamily C protein